MSKYEERYLDLALEAWLGKAALPIPRPSRHWEGRITMAASLAICGGVLWAVFSFQPSGTPPVQDMARVETLIQELDSPSIEVRDRAGEELFKIGDSIRPRLQKLLESGSEEQKARAKELLARLELRSVGTVTFTQDRSKIVMWDGKSLTVLGAGRDPRWSPDGKRLAFESEDDIFLMNADGCNRRRITQNKMRDYSPCWSPNGQRIAFVSDRDGNEEIYVMNADGSDQRPLTLNDVRDHSPDWSPDGSTIAFVSERDGQSEIYVMTVDGAYRELRLTRCRDWDGEPRWSPDGKRIVFRSTRSGGGIFAIDADGSNSDRLLQEHFVGFPAWTRDGSGILFVRREYDREGLLHLLVESGKSHEVGGTLIFLSLRDSVETPLIRKEAKLNIEGPLSPK